MDYELELACVIGKTGKDIAPDKAMEHIFGFAIFNDFSARDAQAAEMAASLGPAKGKDFDTGNVLGPWIVTLDEIGDPHALRHGCARQRRALGRRQLEPDAPQVAGNPGAHLGSPRRSTPAR